MDSVNIYKNGICGYSPQGSQGKGGGDGFHIYYSAYSSNQTAKMIDKIQHNFPLSDNDALDYENVNYVTGDMILANDASMYMIDVSTNLDPESYLPIVTLRNIGSLVYTEDKPDDGTIEDEFCNVFLYIDTASGIYSQNVYNYVGNNDSPLYRHRDTKDSSCYGRYLKFGFGNDDEKTYFLNKVNTFKEKSVKLILNFASGLRFEKIIKHDDFNGNNLKIFIDNRYFYPFGNGFSPYWSVSGYIDKYKGNGSTEEKFDTSINFFTNETDSSDNRNTKCLCSAYIEYYFDNNQYIKSLKIKRAS